jgi:hypothetical protein
MGYGREAELVFELKKNPHLRNWVGISDFPEQIVIYLNIKRGNSALHLLFAK